MNESKPPETPRWAWTSWCIFFLAWTAALLTTILVDAGAAVLSKDFSFYLGKVLHVTAYAILAYLSSRLPVTIPQRWAVLVLISFHAMATEYLQRFVGRYPSWRDVGLNHIGILIGVLVTWKKWRPDR